MSQKSDKFDEFASLFRSVVRPHLEVEPLSLDKLLVVLDVHSDPEKQNGIYQVAESMLNQFKPKLKLFCPVYSDTEVGQAQEQLDALMKRLESKDVELESELRVCPVSYTHLTLPTIYSV